MADSPDKLMRPIRRLVLCAPATVLLTLLSCSSEGGFGQAGPGSPSPTSPDTTEVAEVPVPDIGTWQELAELPQRRTEIGAVALDGLIYVAGGLTLGRELPTELFIYDPVADTWRDGAPMPAPRHHAPMAAHDGQVYVIGGYSSSDLSPAEDSVFIYDVATDSWHDGPSLPEPLGAHAAATTDDGIIHIFGGLAGGVRDVHYALDTATGIWQKLPPLPTRREHLGAAYLDGVIYVAAGRAGFESGLRVFEAYDVATQEWTSLPDVPTGRSGIAVVAYDGQIYVVGGETFGDITRTYDEAERFDPAAGTWEAVTPMPTARHGLGAGALDDGILVVSGGRSPGFTYAAVVEFWRP
jgi:hypothetical protein